MTPSSPAMLLDPDAARVGEAVHPVQQAVGVVHRAHHLVSIRDGPETRPRETDEARGLVQHVGDGPHSGAHGLRRLVLSQQVLEADSVLPRHCYPPQSITPWSLARNAQSPCRQTRTPKPPSGNPPSLHQLFFFSDLKSNILSKI